MEFFTTENNRALVATIVIYTVLLIVLLLWGIPDVYKFQKEQPIVLSFGAAGRNLSAHKPVDSRRQQASQNQRQQVSAPAKKEMLTQNTPSPAEIQAAKRKKEIEAEKRRKAEEEQRRRQQQKQQQQNISDLTQNLFGNNNSKDQKPTGQSGTGGGNNQKGSGRGQGSYSLTGRNVIGSLPRPQGNFQETAKVVVKIRVNKNGQVISATAGERGTTTNNPTLLAAAKKAALKAKFNSDPSANIEQIGTITYNFKITR